MSVLVAHVSPPHSPLALHPPPSSRQTDGQTMNRRTDAQSVSSQRPLNQLPTKPPVVSFSLSVVVIAAAVAQQWAADASPVLQSERCLLIRLHPHACVLLLLLVFRVHSGGHCRRWRRRRRVGDVLQPLPKVDARSSARFNPLPSPQPSPLTTSMKPSSTHSGRQQSGRERVSLHAF